MEQHLRDLIGPVPYPARGAVVAELYADLSVADGDRFAGVRSEIGEILRALREDPTLLEDAVVQKVESNGVVELLVRPDRGRQPKVSRIPGTDHVEVLHPFFQSRGYLVRVPGLLSPEQARIHLGQPPAAAVREGELQF